MSKEPGQSDTKSDLNFDELAYNYLDTYLALRDLYYGPNDDLPEIVKTVGSRVAELYCPERLEDIEPQEKEDKKEARKKDLTFFAKNLQVSEIKCPLMSELIQREIPNRTDVESTIIFIRGIDFKGHEISGYIDFKARLYDEKYPWMDFYTSKKLLLPRPTDLAYYNWATFYCTSNPSANYRLITDMTKGLRFKNRWDRKIITVNPEDDPGDKTVRHDISSPFYSQCVLFDHSMRTKGH